MAHGFGHIDLLDLDRDHLDAERSSVTVDDGLDALVELLAMGEKLVEIHFAEDGAQGCLGELRGLVDVVGDLDDGANRIDDTQRDDCVDLECDVVAGDDILRGNFHGFLAQADANDLVNRTEDPDDSWSCSVGANASETEDDSTLVLLEDLDGVHDI
jgi:hypothetical protein